MRNRWAIMMAAGLLALAGCGEKKPDTGGTTTSLEDATAVEIARFQEAENARSQVTMVDAASGDAAAMPADWNGPTAFDLRPKEGDNQTASQTAEKLKSSMDASVANGPAAPEEFPSVAQ
jgi:hypothetical protein